MRYIHELTEGHDINKTPPGAGCPVRLHGKNRINILALGDVGTTMLTGLRLLGGENISEIGILDIRRENLSRLEIEMNQVGYAFGTHDLPPVHICSESTLFDCDVFIFCASRGVPAAGKEGHAGQDVRMAQLEANRDIIDYYAGLAKAADYRGLAAVVSDPVDPLAAAFMDSAELSPHQVRGYGLGVMNMRALYYSKRLGEEYPEHAEALALYESEGRAFGPHGSDLVIANSIEHYDDEASLLLTKSAAECNLRVRELGFKPYIAPALSSAAIPILLTLRGEWHYSSVFMGDGDRGAFLGVRNRLTENGTEYEDIAVPDALFDRIDSAYKKLCELR